MSIDKSIKEKGAANNMKTLTRMVLALSLVSVAFAADDVVSAVHGTVTKLDSAGHTVVVKTADGTEHSLHLVKETTVHGAHASADAAKDSWHGVTEGSEVVAHYTKRGTEDTALEVDKVGKGGLRATEGTIKDIDRGAKTMVVKTADGTEKTFKLTDHAAKDGGKDIGEGTEKGAKVVVYSTEVSGKKVAHFFEKI
jgi:arginine repressor